MNRRGFLGKISVGLCGFLYPSSKPEPAKIPNLPTLEYLKEHNKDVMVFSATYHSYGLWEGFAYRFYGGSVKANSQSLCWVNGKWIAVEVFRQDEYAKMYYEKEIEWPSWLRRF